MRSYAVARCCLTQSASSVLSSSDTSMPSSWRSRISTAARWFSFSSITVCCFHPALLRFPGERHLLTAPSPSKAIRGVLGKFADLPHEVEAEIRGLDEARRRIAELERQIRKARNSNSPRQLDQVAIERAAGVAVERERTVWRQKYWSGTGRAFGKSPRRWPRQGEPSTNLKCCLMKSKVRWRTL